MREHDLQRREVDGDVVHVHRVGVLQPDAAAARQARADARMPGVEERGQPGLLDHLVERVGQAVVREEALHVGVELEAAHAVLGDQAPRLVDAALPLVRVDARERDQDVGVRPRHRGDLLVRHARLPGERLGVDGEDDRHHLPLAVVRSDLGRRRPRRLAAEVLDRRVAQLVGERVAAALRHLGMRVHVEPRFRRWGPWKPRTPSAPRPRNSASTNCRIGSS